MRPRPYIHVRITTYQWFGSADGRGDRLVAFYVTCDRCPRFGMPLRFFDSAMNLAQDHAHARAHTHGLTP